MYSGKTKYAISTQLQWIVLSYMLHALAFVLLWKDYQIVGALTFMVALVIFVTTMFLLLDYDPEPNDLLAVVTHKLFYMNLLFRLLITGVLVTFYAALFATTPLFLDSRFLLWMFQALLPVMIFFVASVLTTLVRWLMSPKYVWINTIKEKK